MRVPSAAEMSSLSLSSKVAVLYRVTARPTASKPEPTLALVAGTDTLICFMARPPSVVRGQAAQHQLDAAPHRLDLAGRGLQGGGVRLLDQVGAAVVVLGHQLAGAADGLHHGRGRPLHTHIICRRG